MDIIDKINLLIEQREMTKKLFASKLQNLKPILKSTGDVPSLQTIYGYLGGKRELKIELVPYIADVLNVDEQELFNLDIEYASDYNMHKSKEVRKVVELLQYAPKPFITKLIESLEKYEKMYQKMEHRLSEQI